MLRTVHATRYVLPLREGGSLPAIVEADDLGLYVVKFRAAGQGILALLANTVAARRKPAGSLTVFQRAVTDALVMAGPRGEAQETAASILEFMESIRK